MPGGDACPLGIEHQFSKTNSYAPGTLVTDTQNSLVISYHGDTDIPVPVTAEYIFRIINISRVNMNPVGSTKHGRILLAGKSHGRCIDYFHEAVYICGNNSMGQGCIPVKQ